MENIKRYPIIVKTEKEIEIDFKKIYDCIRNEYPDADIYYIGDTFGDNFDYYLEKVFQFNFLGELDADAVEAIWKDFYDWLETNVK